MNRCKVTTLSHPAFDCSVVVAVPAVLSCCPCHVNGKLFWHTVAVVSPVTVCVMNRCKVTTLSHPDTLVSVIVAVPAVLSCCPCHVNGKLFWHTVAVVSPVTACVMNRCKVTTLSHPDTLCNVVVAVPAALSCCPCQLNGNEFWHTVAVVSPVTVCLMNRCSVTTESHPAFDCSVVVAVPAALSCCPCHVNGKLFWQTVAVVSPVTVCVMNRCKVTTESHPAFDCSVVV